MVQLELSLIILQKTGIPKLHFRHHKELRLVCSHLSLIVQIVRVMLVTRFLIMNGVRYSRTQYPLGNAFALTIHKTQSLGLDHICVSLDRSVFSAGQAYTALSRAKRMTGVNISHLDRLAFI